MMYEDLFERARRAADKLQDISVEDRNKLLMVLAGAIETNEAVPLEANALDLAQMDPENPLYDRLKLTPQRLHGIADDMRHVAELQRPFTKYRHSFTKS